MALPTPSVYIVALTLTLAIEAPVYALGLVTTAKVQWRSGGTMGLGVNLVSHPIAFPLLAPAVGVLAALVLVEIGVVYLEAGLVRRAGRVDAVPALLVSCVANVGSLAIGLAVLH